jgi:hypothetical protein
MKILSEGVGEKKKSTPTPIQVYTFLPRRRNSPKTKHGESNFVPPSTNQHKLRVKSHWLSLCNGSHSSWQFFLQERIGKRSDELFSSLRMHTIVQSVLSASSTTSHSLEVLFVFFSPPFVFLIQNNTSNCFSSRLASMHTAAKTRVRPYIDDRKHESVIIFLSKYKIAL